MNLDEYILTIEEHLITTHATILNWFEEPEDVLNFKPISNGWTIAEVLEHIALTSHFLLKLIDKGASKAKRNIHDLDLAELVSSADFKLDTLDEIGIHKSFDWIRPEHMEPSGTKSSAEVKSELINQMRRCLNQLNELSNGEGLLYKTTMTVNGLGKIDVYEYIYFLSKHAERHIEQMLGNKKEFSKS